MMLQLHPDAVLLAEIADRIRDRDTLASLLGEVLATLTLKRNAAPLAEAGVILDGMVEGWSLRLSEIENRRPCQRSTCPICHYPRFVVNAAGVGCARCCSPPKS